MPCVLPQRSCVGYLSTRYEDMDPASQQRGNSYQAYQSLTIV